MKDLLTSFRASNETYNSMKHSARAVIRRAEIPLLAVIVLYKAATNLLFVPLMQQLWSLTLRFAPMHYLSNNNASDIFSSPAIILCITLIAILTAFWALYEFSVLLHGLDLARKGETIRLPALLRTSLADIRHAFLPQNWLVLVYSAVLQLFVQGRTCNPNLLCDMDFGIFCSMRPWSYFCQKYQSPSSYKVETKETPLP